MTNEWKIKLTDIRSSQNKQIVNDFKKAQKDNPEIILNAITSGAYSGVEMLCIFLSLPAIYVLKKIGEKAVGRFADYILDKIESIWKKSGSDVITFSIKGSIEGGSNIDLIQLRMELPEGNPGQRHAYFRERSIAILTYLIEQMRQDKLPKNWVMEWDESSKAWNKVNSKVHFSLRSRSLCHGDKLFQSKLSPMQTSPARYFDPIDLSKEEKND